MGHIHLFFNHTKNGARHKMESGLVKQVRVPLITVHAVLMNALRCACSGCC